MTYTLPSTAGRPAEPRQIRRNRHAALALVACAAACAVAGCAGRDRIYEEIYAHREASFRGWVNEKSGKVESRDVLRGELSLDDCVAIGLVNNKQIAAALLDEDNAQGKIAEAYAQALPKVDLSGRYSRLDKAPGATVGGQSVSFGKADNYTLTASVSQPLFRAGAIGAGIRASRIYSYLSQERFKETKQHVIFSVSRTYYDVLLAQELLKVSEEAVALSQTHVDDVQKRKDQGQASDYDVLRAKVEVTNYQAEMIQNRNRLNLLKTSFYKLLGVSQESDVAFAGPLRHEPIDVSLDDAVDAAFTKRPELIQAELSARLYQENLKAAKAERWPKADLFFDQNLASPDPHDSTSGGWGDSWTAGVSINFPLFDGFKTRGRIRQARADLEKSRVLLADSEETVLLGVKQAVLSLQDAASFIESQEANVGRAREGLKLIEAGYREGDKTELEVRDARQALLKATALHYQAVHQYQAAALEFKQATGSLEAPFGPELSAQDAKTTEGGPGAPSR